MYLSSLKVRIVCLFLEKVSDYSLVLLLRIHDSIFSAMQEEKRCDKNHCPSFSVKDLLNIEYGRVSFKQDGFPRDDGCYQAPSAADTDLAIPKEAFGLSNIFRLSSAVDIFITILVDDKPAVTQEGCVCCTLQFLFFSVFFVKLRDCCKIEVFDFII